MYTYSVCIDPCAVVNSCQCEQKLEAKTENMSVPLDAKTINFWLLGVYKDVTYSSLWLIQPLGETRVKIARGGSMWYKFMLKDFNLTGSCEQENLPSKCK